jgi:hypothetical protein
LKEFSTVDLLLLLSEKKNQLRKEVQSMLHFSKAGPYFVTTRTQLS